LNSLEVFSLGLHPSKNPSDFPSSHTPLYFVQPLENWGANSMGLLPMIKCEIMNCPVIAMDYLTKFITFGALKAFNETKN
jgi:hypothetical protein